MTKRLPLFEVYRWAVAAEPSCWSEVEDSFLSAMWKIDKPLVPGGADNSIRQRGRGSFFAGLTALLVENSSGKELRGGGTAPGLILPKHSLETSYSSKDILELLIETKGGQQPDFRSKLSAGTAREPNYRRPPGFLGQRAAFRAIDLKAKWAHSATPEGGTPRDLMTWLRRSKPSVFLFLAIRVTEGKNFDFVLASAEAVSRSVNGVGIVAYEPSPGNDAYRSLRVPPHLEIDRILSRVCTALHVLP